MGPRDAGYRYLAHDRGGWQAPPMKTTEMERVLLLGGPCDFRTTAVARDSHELMVALPEERPIVQQVYDEIAALSSIPMVGDLKVARYTRQVYLKHRGNLVGAIFEYQETR